MKTYLMIAIAIVLILVIAYYTRDTNRVSGFIASGIIRCIPVKQQAFSPYPNDYQRPLGSY